MLDFEGLFTEHPVFCSVVVIVVAKFYHHFVELVELQKQNHHREQYIRNNQKKVGRRGSLGSPSRSFRQPEDLTVSSTFSSTQSARDLQAKLVACEKIIQSMQKELKSSRSDNSKLKASLETANSKANILEQEGSDMKELLEKEQAKVLNLQRNMQNATPTQLYELEWDKADAMISLVNVQKEIYELESSISMHRFELVEKQKLLVVEMQRVSLQELLGAKQDSEAFIRSEQENLQRTHDALEESIARIEANQQRLLNEQFNSYEELVTSKKQEQVLAAKIEEKDGVIAIQKQQIVQMEKLINVEKEKALNQLEASKIKLESAERKLDGALKEKEYHQKRVEDLEETLKAETKRVEELKGNSREHVVVLRTKDTQIQALESRVASLKERETEQQETIEKLRQLNEQEKERVEKMKLEAERLALDKKEREDALEQVNLKMEAKLEAIMKQKNALKQFEQVYGEEKAKSAKINEQLLPQLYNLIKTEETKAMKLQEELNQKTGQLLKEKLKVQQLQKELSNMTVLIKKNEEAGNTEEGDRKPWFWRQHA